MIMLNCQQREEYSRRRLSQVFIECSSVPGELERAAAAHKSLSRRTTRVLLVHGGNISDACGQVSAIVGVVHGYAGQAQLWYDNAARRSDERRSDCQSRVISPITKKLGIRERASHVLPQPTGGLGGGV